MHEFGHHVENEEFEKLASANALDLGPSRLYGIMEIQPLRAMLLLI